MSTKPGLHPKQMFSVSCIKLYSVLIDSLGLEVAINDRVVLKFGTNIPSRTSLDKFVHFVYNLFPFFWVEGSLNILRNLPFVSFNMLLQRVFTKIIRPFVIVRSYLVLCIGICEETRMYVFNFICALEFRGCKLIKGCLGNNSDAKNRSQQKEIFWLSD